MGKCEYFCFQTDQQVSNILLLLLLLLLVALKSIRLTLPVSRKRCVGTLHCPNDTLVSDVDVRTAINTDS